MEYELQLMRKYLHIGKIQQSIDRALQRLPRLGRIQGKSFARFFFADNSCNGLSGKALFGR